MAKKVVNKGGGSVKKLVYLDFEFNQVSEENVNLVSCVTRDGNTGVTTKFWLHNSPKAQSRLIKHLQQYEIIIGYQCVAEARSFLALNLDPLQFKWIDMFLEYRMLTNHNDALQWGWQLVKGQKKFVTKPKPKWERTEEDKKSGFKATHSLAEATFKLTGQVRDTVEKDETRKLIISNPKRFTEEERERILNYNKDDVDFLPTIWKRIKEEYVKFVGGVEKKDMADCMLDYYEAAMLRGRYSAHTAIMESIGYPINVEATRNFSRQIPSILAECQRDINSQFTGIMPFKWKKSQSVFSWNQKVTKEWIEQCPYYAKWPRTKRSKKFPNGQLSLALEDWEKFYPFKHDYPRGNFGAQIVRYLKLKQSLAGFTRRKEDSDKKIFWDHVGSDDRVRPYMNIYGAQSSRSQPGSIGFMFLKPAWMRALVQPKEGYFLAGVDYGQQEFFLSGLESGDKNMIDAYLSGDPYLFGAKLAGVIPKDGTREKFEIERDVFKNTYLGILFGMTKYGLSIKLTNDTGRPYDEDEAQDQIDIFDDSYPDYVDWRKDQLDSYMEGKGIVLPCGWMVGIDNENPRSVLNVPIQGRGASIMRKAVDIAVTEYHIKIIKTLHDALYMQGKVGQEHKVIELMEAMKKAFQFYYKGTPKYDIAGNIKLDPKIWGPGYESDERVKCETDKKGNKKYYLEVKGVKVPCSNLYIDKRSQADYDRFSRYFETPDIDLL